MPPSVEPPIEITIVNDSTGKQDCDACCGLDWSSPESISLARQRIEERFGERVKLGFIDLAKTKNSTALRLKRRISEENVILPALIIDNEVRISGQFDMRLLLDAIDAEVEIKR